MTVPDIHRNERSSADTMTLAVAHPDRWREMVPIRDSPSIVSIGGAPSSGTTLLADLFDSIPGAACGPELNVLCIPKAFAFDPAFRASAFSTSWETGCAYAPRSRFLNARHLAAIGLDDASAREILASAEDLPEFMHRLVAAFSRHRGRPIDVLAEKTPANVTCAGLFLERFPKGRFIHVVRDGRSLAASLRRRGFTLWEAAIVWLTQVHRGLALRDHPRCLTVRYEDIVAEPFRTASRLAGWMGIDATPAEIQCRFQDNTYRASLPRVAQWLTADLPRSEVHQTDSFRAQLSNAEIAFLESSGLDRFDADGDAIRFRHLLAELGYQANGGETAPSDAVILLAHADFILRTRNAAEHRNALLWHMGYEPPTRRLRLHARVRARALPTWMDVGRPSVRAWLSRPSGASIGLHAADRRLQEFLRQEGVPMTERPGCPDAGSLAMSAGVIAAIDRQASPAYRLRALGPPKDPAPTEDLATRVSRLLTTHLYACCRKLAAGRPFGRENAMTLALACHAARRASFLEAEFDRAMHALAISEVPPTDAMVALPWTRTLLVSSHLRRLHDAVALSEFPDSMPAYQSAIRGALVAIVLKRDSAELREQLVNLLRDHEDPHTGLMIDRTVGDPISSKPYLSPLVPLALVCAAERLGLALTSSDVGLPRPAAPEGDSLDEWLLHAQRLLSPPDLPIALQPQCPDGHAASVLRAVTRSAVSAMVDRCGWAVTVRATPPEAPFVVSIRHDIDRPLRSEHAARVLMLHERYGRCTSVYFRPATFDAVAARELRDAGCELGVHMSLWDDAHRRLRDSLCALAGVPVGVTYHGGLGSRYWRGLRSVRADLEAGVAYTELLHEWSPDPREVRLASKSIMATPLSVKVDAQPDWVERHLRLVRDFRGQAILELHPDLPGASWDRIIAGCLAEGALPRRVVDHVERCRAATAATVEAQVREHGVAVTIRAEQGLAVLVRTDPTVFEQDCPRPAMRLGGRLAPGGLWKPYAMDAGECTVLLRPASASATRTPASPRP